MRRWMLVAVLVLGTGAVAHGPGAGEQPTAASAGAGGAAEAESGQWARAGSADPNGRAQRQLYEQVARELGLEAGALHARGPGPGEAPPGCAGALAAGEPATVVSGTLRFASGDVLTLSVPGKGEVMLRADASTCAVQRGREQTTESLSEGTEVRAAYVMEEGKPTARVVHAEPQRSLR